MSAKNTILNICFIDGDERQFFAAKELSKRDEFNVIVSGKTFAEKACRCRENLSYEENHLKA